MYKYTFADRHHLSALSFVWTSALSRVEYVDMLQYNEVRPGRVVIIDGEPYVCMWNNVMQKQQRRPVNQTKMRNLIRGNTIEHSFGQSDKVEEAEVESRPAVFIYKKPGRNGNEWWFHPVGKASDRYMMTDAEIGEGSRFLLTGMEVTTKWFEGKIIQAALPIKVDLKVVEAPPSIRGNTAQGGTKIVILETGATIDAPLFVEAGDKIRINTELGEYVERA